MTRVRPYDPLKRAIDIVVASIIYVLTLPVQVVIAVLIRRKLGAPALFRQNRPGLNGELFELVKFRTMLEDPAAEGPASDDQRLTPFGRRLRSLSLDELPTLLNVIRGDMSLVGPRPLLVAYLDHYSSEQSRRHSVRPGVTGLAQVSGRNAVSWADKFRLDIEYVDGRSLTLDLEILVRTIAPVLTRRGINENGVSTVTEFKGNDLES